MHEKMMKIQNYPLRKKTLQNKENMEKVTILGE